ncbi:uncharacterized protein LOC143599418 [Bidens hawaiensis]|uniref:uncharacterized protein LOC143599418 n=1 Tax=Bidens hawaiensis TaxID=980011 RepID=UPI00404B8AAD
MEPATIFVLFSSFSMFMQLEASRSIVPHISVMGKVYCNTCSNHTFLLSGAEVSIDCKFDAVSPKTDEQISFSVNRTTNRYGVYRLDMRVPSVDGIFCARDAVALNKCRATLIRSTSPSCNMPGLTATTNDFSLESKHDSVCVYNMFALSFGASKKDPSVCGK